MTTKRKYHIPFFLTFFFGLFILYGTLIPFNFSGFGNLADHIRNIQWIPFFTNEGRRTSIPDIVQNILLFIPFGFFVWFLSKRQLSGILTATLAGSALSIFVELLQLFTEDRISSVTDLITNTAGTFIGTIAGMIFYSLWSVLIHIEAVQKALHEKYLLPVCITAALVFSELLQPFDFTLDVSSVYGKVKAILHNPFSVSFHFRDEVFVLFLFSGFSYILATYLTNHFNRIRPFKYLTGASLFAVSCEFLQFIVTSRSPEFGDALVGVAGVSIGYALFRMRQSPFCGFSFAVLYLTGVFCKTMYPFRLKLSFTKMNLLPFYSEYANTTMTSLGNTIEAGIIFFAGGYLITRYTKRFHPIISVVTLLVIFVTEFLQGFIQTRYPDITDILMGWLAVSGGMYFGYRGEEKLHRFLLESIAVNRNT
jgi:glycopeptide antibiotics resistance protein